MSFAKIKPVILELAKWGLVFWLLAPAIKIQDKVISFPRLMAGIMLFIVFSGKMLYDIMISGHQRHSERSHAADLLATVGMVVVVSLIVGLFVVLIGYLVITLMQQATTQPE